MKAIIRIHGLIKVKEDVAETLNKLRLRKKYTCVLINETPESKGMIEKVRDYAAYGDINEKTLAEMIKFRGKVIGNSKAKPKDPEKLAKDILAGKKAEELGIKPFFRLHPPRKGINTKAHFPKGALGNHEDKINDLIKRML